MATIFAMKESSQWELSFLYYLLLFEVCSKDTLANSNVVAFCLRIVLAISVLGDLTSDDLHATFASSCISPLAATTAHASVRLTRVNLNNFADIQLCLHLFLLAVVYHVSMIHSSG